MPRVHFVKSARKPDENAGIAVGDSYYWWAFKLPRGGYKVKSKTKPKPSQLTRSEFWGAVLGLKESHETVPTDVETLQSERDEIVQDLEGIRDETQEKFENMPQNLQQGDTGQTLESRVTSVNDALSEIESVDCDITVDDDEADEGDGEEEKEERLKKKIEEAWDEITGALENISD